GDHGERQRRGRRPRRAGRGGDRGRRDHDRVQCPVPGRRAHEHRRGPVRPRAQRAPVSGRLQTDRRRPLRPRRHAAPDDLLTGPPDGGEVNAPGRLRSISIQGLRSYASLDARFGGGPQLIVGPNAAGKTTLLEAIVLLAWGRSHRTSTDGELVRWGQELARIEGVAGAETVEVALVRPADGPGARKRIR